MQQISRKITKEKHTDNVTIPVFLSELEYKKKKLVNI